MEARDIKHTIDKENILFITAETGFGKERYFRHGGKR